MQRAMLCKARAGTASKVVWEHPSPKKNKGIHGQWWGTLWSLAALHQLLLLSMLSTTQVSTASQTSNSQIQHDALHTERSCPKMVLMRVGTYTGLWSFPSFFPDFFLEWRRPSINIYLLLETLTRRQNPHRTQVLEVLRTVVIGLRLLLSC